MDSMFDIGTPLYNRCKEIRYIMRNLYKDTPIPTIVEDVYNGRCYMLIYDAIAMSNGKHTTLMELRFTTSMKCEYHAILHEAQLKGILEEELVSILVDFGDYDICIDHISNLRYIVHRLSKLHDEYPNNDIGLVKAIKRGIIYSEEDKCIVKHENGMSTELDMEAIDILYHTMNVGMRRLISNVKIDAVLKILKKYKW